MSNPSDSTLVVTTWLELRECCVYRCLVGTDVRSNRRVALCRHPRARGLRCTLRRCPRTQEVHMTQERQS